MDAVWPGWGHASENPKLPAKLKETSDFCNKTEPGLGSYRIPKPQTVNPSTPQPSAWTLWKASGVEGITLHLKKKAQLIFIIRVGLVEALEVCALGPF